jgi:spore coat protein CotH
MLQILAVCGILALPVHGADQPPATSPGSHDSSGPPGGPEDEPDFVNDDHGPAGGMPRQKASLVSQFDQDKDGHLNKAERKAAREYLAKQPMNRGFGGPPGGGGPGHDDTPGQPGRNISPAEVKNYPGEPLYDTGIIRTFFLEFENPAWEAELADFKTTDVEVPAKLTVDGKTYPDVGVRFRGNSSYMMVSEGRKRSFSLNLDFINEKQQLGGYHTVHLLNSHEDASFMRTVLFSQIAREYLPSPKANWVRLVVNGESWGLYVNAEQINKDFFKEWYGTKKGARWKVPGSPDGRGGLSYLGEDADSYKRIYELKSKADPQAWAALIKLCKTLNETPADQLEKALEPMLDLEGTLKFLALDNATVNGDGFWTRASDYYLYLDVKGRFHFYSQDVNETFSTGGGPGGAGGPGGGPGGGPPGGGPGGFGPGMFLAPRFIAQADKNGDRKVSLEELKVLAENWAFVMDADKTGKITQKQFTAKFAEVMPNQTDGRGGPGNFDPANFIAAGFFTTLDANQDGALTLPEIQATFSQWCAQWDTAKSGALTEEHLRAGLNEVLPKPNFAGRGGPGGGRGGGPGGPPGMGGGGVNLDPLVGANNPSNPLISKLLAVPALRTRYLGYVRDIAEKRIAWDYLGALVRKYQALIAEDVKADTRKLDSYEDFINSLEGRAGAQASGLKGFCEKRRAYLLNYSETKKASP